MEKRTIVEKLENQDWLQPVENTVQNAVRSAFEAGGSAGKKVEDFLHGKWLGHPLHPALTDVPIGAWTAAVVLDAGEVITGSEELGQGADAAVAVGLVGAVGAAVTGLTDYQNVSGEARRVGLIHAVTNVGAVTLFTASLIARRRQSRGWGRVLSSFGLAVGMGGAWLGGHLVFKHEVGVAAETGEEDSRYTRMA